MAPPANKIGGPSAVRHLLEAGRIYQRTVKDVVATIQGAIGEGLPVGRELEYAKLLMALTEVERALQWLAEQSRSCSARLRRKHEGHTPHRPGPRGHRLGALLHLRGILGSALEL